MAPQWHGIIWDLDGTLADTLLDIANAVNAALAIEGIAAKPIDAYRGLVGRGSRRLIEDAAPACEPAAIDRMHAAFVQHYADHVLDHTKLYDGVEARCGTTRQAASPWRCFQTNRTLSR